MALIMLKNGTRRIAMVCALLLAAASAVKADLTLSDFNGVGFQYTFDNFVQTPGPTSVRLTDLGDGWGGGGVFVGQWDLSPYADGRVVVDFTPEQLNGVTQFDIELKDVNNNSGKWTFELPHLPTGVGASLVAKSTLSNPGSGIGNVANLDLSRIKEWQVLGHFGTAGPFDISFDKVAVSQTLSYGGQESSAPWRQEANQRIDAVRKADLSVSVVDLAGNTVPNAAVQVLMNEHEFGFGAAVQAFRLSDNLPQNQQYKDKVAELFNVATLENNLKWPFWEGEHGNLWTQAGAVAALDWLQAEDITSRGHVLVWPGRDNLPADIRQLLDAGPLSTADQQAVRDRITAHIASIGHLTAGKLEAWDVVNEVRTNNDLMQQLSEGDGAIADWFAQARAAAPSAKLYLNEYGILAAEPGQAASNQSLYFNTIQTLMNDGAPIDGVGLQSHFYEGNLVAPQQVWAILDRFEELGLEIQVTEFDFDTTNEQLQAEFTRDFLTAVFAHQGVSDLISWGFWEAAHWRPNAAYFRSDWSIKPNGQAFLDLVFDEWWTDESLKANTQGAASVRGFKGSYDVFATHGEDTGVATAVLTGGGTAVEVVVPILVGDYNGDGVVDGSDYATWRNTTESTVDLAADGNGDGIIDHLDFLVWRDRFGATVATSTLISPSVPEPTSFALVAMLLFPSLVNRARHRGPTKASPRQQV